MVWFLPSNVKTTRPSKKLDYKKMEPFKIIQDVGTSSYKLDPRASMTIHNTFHISLLELYEDKKFPSQIQTPPPSIEIEGEPEYELEEIIDSGHSRDNLQYHTKWTSYSPKHDRTRYSAENFSNARIAIEQFHSQYTRKPRMGKPHNNHGSLRTSTQQKWECPNGAASYRPKRMEQRHVPSSQCYPY